MKEVLSKLLAFVLNGVGNLMIMLAFCLFMCLWGDYLQKGYDFMTYISEDTGIVFLTMGVSVISGTVFIRTSKEME